jgi:hypothetical protein
MLEVFDLDSDTPELIWNGAMRADLRKVIGIVLDDVVTKQRDVQGSFTLPANVTVHYVAIESELFIGGVYVGRFLKEPTFSLRDPTAFLEHLLQRWAKELQAFTVPRTTDRVFPPANPPRAEHDVLNNVTTAIVFLCRLRNNLCDKLAEWGYISRMLQFLEVVLERDLVGTPLLSVIRLLHVAAGRMVNVEALSLEGQGDNHRGVVRSTMRSINSDPLHEDCAFMVEFIKKIYDVGLGDVKSSLMSSTSMFREPAIVRFGPSPSPGEGPVRKRVDDWENPLAMMGPPPTTQQMLLPIPSNLNSFTANNSAMDGENSLYQPHGTTLGSTSTMNSTYLGQPHNIFGAHPPVLPSQTFMPSSVIQSHSGDQTYHQSYLQRSLASQRLQPPSGNQGQSFAPSHAGATPAHPYQQSYHQGPTDQPPRQAYGPPAPPSQDQRHYQQPVQAFPGSAQHDLNASYRSPQFYQGAPAQALPQVYEQPAQPKRGQDQRQVQTYGGSSQHYAHPSRPNQQVHHQTASIQPPQQHYHQPGPIQPPQQFHQQPAQSHELYRTEHVNVPQQMRTEQTQSGMRTPVVERTGAPHMAQTSYMPAAMNAGYTNQHAHEVGPSHIHGQGFQQNLLAQQGQLQDRFRETNQQAGSVMYASNDPVVETVPEPTYPQQYRPTPIEGTGIDARTQEDPRASAEQQSMSTAGAPGAAQGRIALLQQALDSDLCEFLVNDVLENPGLASVRDPAAAKVHSIALLKLLGSDPGYGPKFKLILSGLPAWNKYKSQDHSLLITGHEQKADYFLTDGGAAEKKLLTTE